MGHCLKPECTRAKIVIQAEQDGTFNVVEGVELLSKAVEGGILDLSSATLSIKPNTDVEYPIFIDWQSMAERHSFTLCMGRNSRLHLIESYGSESTSECQIRIDIEDNAQLEHYRLLVEQAQTENNLQLSLARHANYRSFYLIEGLTDEEKRYDVDIKLQGEGAESAVYGAYLTENLDKIKLTTLTQHLVPHTTSDEIFRGMLNDSSKVAFDGRILIVQDAQKTQGDLSNKNLLLSDKAHIDTKPELEIYADDVQCSHGATVSQLDELSLHYLKTRGIDDMTAKNMISFSFIAEVLAKMPASPCHQAFKEQIAKYIGRELEGDEYEI